jgi:septum formation protein
MLVKKKLILASGSPRRQHLLRQIGLPFEVRESGIDEGSESAGDPVRYVSGLSERKAEAVGKTIDNAVIIGADTIVRIDGEILGKPVNRDDAARMLRMLSGRTHEVYTGVSIIDRPSGRRMSAVEVTRVTFRPLEEDEIRSYVSTGAPMDKAGAYGIQDDMGAVFVDRIEGCFYNVVGLPLSRLFVMLREFQKQLDSD